MSLSGNFAMLVAKVHEIFPLSTYAWLVWFSLKFLLPPYDPFLWLGGHNILPYYIPIMGPRKLISKVQIYVICALVRKNKSNLEIAGNTGIALRSVQWWTKIYHKGGGDASPPSHKPKGRKHSVSQRTLNIICRQLEAHPRIHSKEHKARNPALLAGVSERAVPRYVKHGWGYWSCCAV